MVGAFFNLPGCFCSIQWICFHFRNLFPFLAKNLCHRASQRTTYKFQEFILEAVDVFFDLQGCFHWIQQFFSFQKPRKSHFWLHHNLTRFLNHNKDVLLITVQTTQCWPTKPYSNPYFSKHVHSALLLAQPSYIFQTLCNFFYHLYCTLVQNNFQKLVATLRTYSPNSWEFTDLKNFKNQFSRKF